MNSSLSYLSKPICLMDFSHMEPGKNMKSVSEEWCCSARKCTFNKTFISQSLKTDGGVTGGQAAVEILISINVSRCIQAITAVYYLISL